MTYTIRTITKLGKANVDVLLCCAFEGGSTYWISQVVVPEWPEGAEYAHEVPALDGDLVIVTHEGEEHKVSPIGIADAFQIMHDDFPDEFNNVLEETEDANTGDLFLQLLCFGEVVYG